MAYSSTKSEVARSLEKIALEKGLIKPEPVNSYKSPTEAFKAATALTPSDNLAENILKLCAGLRTQGFDKYASEIEVKFLQYKQADASGLYDVWHHGEPKSGEELLYQAHPDGSHKMVDMDGDVVVEDLLEKQKKIQQTILKTPTGKLAAKDAVNIAKIILAAVDPITGIDIDAITAKVNEAVSDITAIIDSILVTASTSTHFDPNVGNFFSHPWETLKQHKSLLFGATGPIPMLVAVVAQFWQKYKTTLQDLKKQLAADKEDFDTDHSDENLNNIIARFQELGQLVGEMPNTAQTVKDNVNAHIVNATKTINEASTMLHAPAATTQTTAPTPQAPTDPTTKKILELEDKIDASLKANKMTVEQHNQFGEALFKANQALKDPQKAPQARQAVEQMEQWLINKKLI